jgi:hypothetical protein
VSAPRSSTNQRLLAGTVLVLLGLAAWALFALQNARERHSYAHGLVPPAYVELHAGKTYSLAIPGGVHGEENLGLDPAKLSCTAARPGQEPAGLSVTPEHSDTKAIQQIGSFTPGFSGSAHVECTGIGVVFVDDADNASFDWSGLWLIVASAALVVGLPLTLSGLRRPRAAAPA